MLRNLLDFYRKLKELNRLLDSNRGLALALQEKEKALSAKDIALLALEKTLKNREEQIEKKIFDCEIREVLIEAREAANQ